MSFVHDATVAFDYDGVARARVVERSVSQEVGEIDGERSRTGVFREGTTVRVTVEAADIVALRAALNTWLSLVDVAERSIDVADGSVDGAA